MPDDFVIAARGRVHHSQATAGTRLASRSRGPSKTSTTSVAGSASTSAWIAAASPAAAPARSRHQPLGREPTTLAPSTTIRVTLPRYEACQARLPRPPPAAGLVDESWSSTGRLIGKAARFAERAGSAPCLLTRATQAICLAAPPSRALS